MHWRTLLAAAPTFSARIIIAHHWLDAAAPIGQVVHLEGHAFALTGAAAARPVPLKDVHNRLAAAGPGLRMLVQMDLHSFHVQLLDNFLHVDRRRAAGGPVGTAAAGGSGGGGRQRWRQLAAAQRVKRHTCFNRKFKVPSSSYSASTVGHSKRTSGPSVQETTSRPAISSCVEDRIIRTEVRQGQRKGGASAWVRHRCLPQPPNRSLQFTYPRFTTGVN